MSSDWERVKTTTNGLAYLVETWDREAQQKLGSEEVVVRLHRLRQGFIWLHLASRKSFVNISAGNMGNFHVNHKAPCKEKSVISTHSLLISTEITKLK